MRHGVWGRQATETTAERVEMSDLTDFKVTIINMFKRLTKTMIKVVKDGIMTISSNKKIPLPR